MNAMTKRWICIALCLVLMTALFGCRGSGRPEETTASPEETTQQLPQETTEQTTAPEQNSEAPEQTTAEPKETVHTHSYEEAVTAPSCTTGGYTIYTCVCGDSYTGNETTALGHSYTAKVHEPSEGVQGYTEYTCTRCGLSYKDEFTFQSGSDLSFFDDAAFIGDSVTLKLRNYHMSTGALGNATFLCVGSYSVNNAVTNQLYLSYQGQDMTPQDALAACGAKKVFILLGMNDIALFGENSISVAMDNWSTMLASIRQKNPGIQVYIQSGTPIYTGGEKGGLNNNRMDSYNVSLKAFAEANGCYYIDIATPLKDSTNGLAAQYCSDSYVHFTDAACKLWVDMLKSYVGA